MLHEHNNENVSILENSLNHAGMCLSGTDCDSVWQVAVTEPGTNLSVQRHVAEIQTHRHAAEEPDGAAQARQRQRAVITETNEMTLVFLFDT